MPKPAKSGTTDKLRSVHYRYKAPYFESTVIYAHTMNDVTFSISVKVQLLLSFSIAVKCALFCYLGPE